VGHIKFSPGGISKFRLLSVRRIAFHKTPIRIEGLRFSSLPNCACGDYNNQADKNETSLERS